VNLLYHTFVKIGNFFVQFNEVQYYNLRYLILILQSGIK